MHIYHFVYVLRCGDGTLYTGYTTDVERRFFEHKSGKGSRYVRARGASEVVYQETCVDKSSALKREIAIKKMTHIKKQELIQSARVQGRIDTTPIA